MSNESENEETPPFDVERAIAENQRIRDIGYRNYWNRMAQQLVGKTIVEARYLTKEEVDGMGMDWWYDSTVSLLLSDGTFVFTSRDDEMNGAGVLKAFRSDGTEIVMPHIPMEEWAERQLDE